MGVWRRILALRQAGPVEGGLPAFARPMLATPGQPPAGPGWAVEFKWDGIRAIVAADAGEVRLWSRNGNDVTAAYPELAVGETAAGLGGHGPLLVDGEIVALDAGGRPSFSRLAERMHVRTRRPSSWGGCR